jgi:hypothetical protein
LFKGYGAKVGLGNMRVKAENRMLTDKTKLPVEILLWGKCKCHQDTDLGALIANLLLMVMKKD